MFCTAHKGSVAMRLRGARMRACALAFGVVICLAVPATSPGAAKTTKPSQVVLIQVALHDWGITMGVQQQVEPGQYAYASANSANRGQIGDIFVQNLGKKPHSFALLGKKTKVLKPGGRGFLHLQFLVRGSFPWQSPVDKNKKGFRGVFIVT
jgi:hypothetical protein